MISAAYHDKGLVVDILARSFDDNRSVNYIVKQDKQRPARLRRLMEYSFDVCKLFGEVYLSEDKKACALIVYPDKKRTTPRSMILDIKLVFGVIGLRGIKKALRRESTVHRLHAAAPGMYLWFIGVDPAMQKTGVGSRLLQELIAEATTMQRTIFLETSAARNIPWYEKHGFYMYKKIDVGYDLYCLKWDYGESVVR